MTELSRRERAIVAEFGIHPEDTTPAAEARRNGWTPGTRLHGGPIRVHGVEVEQPVDIVLTAVGLEQVLAIPASGDGAERSVTFDARQWEAI